MENVEYTPENSITVLEAGTYQISYNANLTTADADGAITLAVNDNNQAIVTTSTTATIQSASPVNYNGTIIADLGENAILNIKLTTALSTGTISVNNARLNIVKLS